MYKEKAKINPRRREAVCIWLVLWIGASQIQFMYTNLLIVGYAGAIGIMVLYLKLENPETNLDRKTGLFNSNALYQYAREFYAKDEDFSLLVIVFASRAYKNIRLDRRAAIKMQIIEYLMKIPDSITFKNAEDEYFVVFTNMGVAEKRVKEIRERFQQSWDEDKDKESVVLPHWLYLPHANVVDKAGHLLYLVRYVRQEEKEFSRLISLVWGRRLWIRCAMNVRWNGLFWKRLSTIAWKCFTSRFFNGRAPHYFGGSACANSRQ